jgi:hypothetical protein
MNATEMVFTVIGAGVTTLAALTSLAWWIYKRGQAAGEERAGRAAARAEDKAQIAALERQLAETRAQVAAISPQTKRKRP